MARISFNVDDDLLLGIRETSKDLDCKPSKYICDLIKEDIKSRLQYKLIAFYDSGKIKVEEEFYSASDFIESFMTYEKLYSSGMVTRAGILKGYKAYGKGILIKDEGETE